MSAPRSFRNRKWILASRPDGTPRQADFAFREEIIDTAGLRPSEIVVRNLYTICAPDQRNWMNANINFHPPLQLGDTIFAPTASRVVASSDARYPEGMLAFVIGGWSDYTVLDVENLFIPIIPYPDGVSPLEALAVFGMNQVAAYFGLTKIGRPRPGETLLVSGAAGSAGSAAAQIGKIMGCHVIGIAGGREKCDWLSQACGLDAVIDYKAEDVSARLRELAGDRIDIFFDNVGGDMLQAGFDNMAPHGRIVLCGMISGYTGTGRMRGPDNFMRMVHGALRMEGFVAQTWASEIPDAVARLREWVGQGLIKHREDVRTGLENLPEIFPDLFRGGNSGTLVVKLADEDAG